MRDLTVVGIFGSVLPFAFRSPFVGLLLYYWVSIMNPHRYSWGFSYDLPLAQISAIVTIISCIINIDQLRVPKAREMYFFLLFWGFITFTTVHSIYPQDAWVKWQDVSKIFLMTFLTMTLLTTRKRLLYFVIAIIAYLGVIGVKGAIFGLATAGKYKIWGPPDSFIADNNDVGLAMVIVTPLSLMIKNVVQNRWASRSLFGMGLASMTSAILTYSRGAMLGIGTTLICFFLTARHKLRILILGGIVVALVISLLPSSWFMRMSTLKSYDKDNSANQRINSWIFSFNLAKAYKLGGGFDCFSEELYYQHAPDPELSKAHTSHSIYFQVLAHHGFAGLGIFLFCFLSIIHSLNKILRASKKLHGYEWISNYCHAFIISMIGFLVSGAFLSRAYFDLIWAIFAAAVCFKSIVYTGSWLESSDLEAHACYCMPESKHELVPARA